MAKQQIEKHQYGFSFMNEMTGGQHVKEFWGIGDKETAKADAYLQAERYRQRYEDELNEKARCSNTSCCTSSHIGVSIVSCSFVC